MVVRFKKIAVFCFSLLIDFSLSLSSLPVSAEPDAAFEMQPWFNPAAGVFTKPEVQQDPELFSRRGLETLWTGVHGGAIGPDCPLLLCATHPLGLALIAGGLAKNPNREETMKLAEALMEMFSVHGNRYRDGIPFDNLSTWHSRVEALCRILSLSVQIQERQGARRMVITCNEINPNVPLYSDEPGDDSLVKRCLEQCPCASLPDAGPAGVPGGPQPDQPPGQPQIPQPPGPQPGQPQGPQPPGPQPEQPQMPQPPSGITPDPAGNIMPPPTVEVIPPPTQPPAAPPTSVPAEKVTLIPPALHPTPSVVTKTLDPPLFTPTPNIEQNP